VTDTPMYHAGSRAIQDRFDSRRIADRLEQVTVHTELSEWDAEFIAQASMFFLATADADGWPDCSYKGGLPGFVAVLDARTLAFPSYDGNGMFRSLGNIAVNPRVGILFIDFERVGRMRVNGSATILFDEDLLAKFEGAQAVVRVDIQRVFPNCPRYIHRMQVLEHSVYAPAPGHVPPVPDWKRSPDFRDALPGT
jgi:uncharacterized protein